MSRAAARKGRTEATRKIKDAKVLKSSHGKFATVFDLEKHREAETKANKASKKKK
jgi:hypothetical protein